MIFVRELVFVSTFSALLLPAPGPQDVVDKRRFDVLDFEGLPAGTILDAVHGRAGLGPVGVTGVNPLLGAPNAAVLFDSSSPTGGDFDLGTPNVDFGGPGIGAGGSAGSPFQNDRPQGNTLIVGADLTDSDGDGLVDDPDDTDAPGSRLSFDFSALGAVTPVALTVIDTELGEVAPEVAMYDAAGALVDRFDLPITGDNGRVVVDLGGLPDVVTIDVTLNGSATIDDLRFEVSPRARLVGRVWDDFDGDGYQDRGEPGIPGAVVTLTPPATGPLATVTTATTNDFGVWSFAGLEAGTYVLDVDPLTLPKGSFPSPCDVGDDDERDSDCLPSTLALSTGQIVANVDFGFDNECDGVIGDAVFIDNDGDNVQSPGDSPLAGARVNLFDPGFVLLDSVLTDANGEYSFHRLCPGQYMLTVIPNPSAPPGLVGDLGPVICNVGGDDTIDSECGPVCVEIFPFTLGEVVDDSIDFGFAECGDCDGGMTALSMRFDGATNAFVEVRQDDEAVVFSGRLDPGETFSFFGALPDGTFGPRLRFFVRQILNAEFVTDCSAPIFIGQLVGDFAVRAGTSAGGGTLCDPGG